ncbi:MAG: peptidylprolyl isomerase [Bacteroidales bacterium]|nr:peptidylprolyl isomerase [Bacteroidales bacterium]
MKTYSKILGLIVFALIQLNLSAQEIVVDQIAAVVGKNPILKSEVETQYLQFRMQGMIQGGNAAKCEILENMLFQKLLLNQAEVDSINVSDEQVERNLDQRLRYFISQIGSEKKLEEYYNKSIEDIKDEFREMIREQLLTEQAQNEITANVKVTPSEVKKFYDRLPKDSIPMINAQYEIGHIVAEPPLSSAEVMATRDRLKAMRERIIKGENFSTLAILYSEDPGSAKKGGELGLFGRGEMYPEFEAAAFSLKTKGEVSEIVKTKSGFHILQLIERKGEYVNVRHILIMPKMAPENMEKAITKLDSVAKLIRSKSISFKEAALKFSDNPDKINGGMMVNPQTSTTKWDAEQLDASLNYAVRNLKVGEVSAPLEMVSEENTKAYRIVYVKSITEPHKANLDSDYNQIQLWATEEKKGQVIQDWISSKTGETYVRIMPEYQDCSFKHNWSN